MKINKLYKKIIMFFGGVYKKKLPKSPEPTMKLGRNVNHDARSLNFPFNTTGLEIVNVKHERYVPIFDQLNIGRCTGCAGIGAISTSPFENKENNVYKRDIDGATQLYSDATAIDPYNGTYPPNDTGSDGLSIAKALTNANLISSYQHTFTLQDALKAGSKYAWICGTSWFSDMFNPDPDGRVHPTGNLVGGHEYQLSQINVDNGKIWFFNSWSDSWGFNGSFYMTWEDFASLLKQNGDVTILIPKASTPVDPQNPTRATLRRGMRGTDVTYLQQSLKTLSFFSGVVDGIYGVITERAVKAFQSSEKIKSDGIVGKVSWTHLESALKKKPSLAPSENCYTIIKEFEGFRSKPYKDVGGKFTIGFGSTIDKNGNPITAKTPAVTTAEALWLLKRDVDASSGYVNNEIKGIKLNQNQYDAIISFVFNVGIGAFRRSALLRNLKNKCVIKRNFTDWRLVGGKIIQGLVNRRQKEWELYSK